MSIVIGFPHANSLDVEFARSLIHTLNENTDDAPATITGIIMQPAPSGLVQVARNHIVRQFLKSSCEWLLWLNTDKVWKPSAVHQLHATATKNNLLVVNAHVRNPPAEGQLGTTPVLFDHHLNPVEPPPGATLFRVFCAGMGFMLTHRSVYTKILETQGDGPQPWFSYEEWIDRVVGEDLAFCRRLQDAGIEVWVDNQVEVGHRKMFTFQR